LSSRAAFPQPPGALSASRSSAGDCAPVQAGRLNRAILKPDRQRRGPTILLTGFSRAGFSDAIASQPRGRPWKISKVGTATCWRRSKSRARCDGNRRWRLIAPFPTPSAKLIGAYFLNEYSFEASALFNPSIVPHPDQSDAPQRWAAFHSQSPGRRRRPCVFTDISGPARSQPMAALTVDPTARLASSPRVSRRISNPDGDPS